MREWPQSVRTSFALIRRIPKTHTNFIVFVYHQLSSTFLLEYWQSDNRHKVSIVGQADCNVSKLNSNVHAPHVQRCIVFLRILNDTKFQIYAASHTTTLVGHYCYKIGSHQPSKSLCPCLRMYINDSLWNFHVIRTFILYCLRSDSYPSIRHVLLRCTGILCAIIFVRP